MNLKVRPYKPGDEISISEMFTRNTPYLRDNAFWIWINRLLPIYPSLIAVIADEKDEIQGHTAIMPYEIKVGERIIKCGMSYHTIIDKDYRNQDLVMPLLELADTMATEAGLEFHYGFPNKNARPIYKLPNHYKVSKFYALERESVTGEDNNKSNLHYSFELIKETDYDLIFSVNQLCEKRKKDVVELCRSLQYYCVRYFFHPQKLYNSYKIFKDGVFVGCVVTKLYEKEGKKYFHILDLFVDEELIDYELLIDDLTRYFSDICDIFSFWKINEHIKEILIKQGFQENGFDTFLGLCFLPNNKLTEEEKSLLLDFKNWRIVMGDSDAF